VAAPASEDVPELVGDDAVCGSFDVCATSCVVLVPWLDPPLAVSGELRDPRRTVRR
jgi:hypothetical protein